MVTESLEVRSGGLGLRALLARAVGVDGMRRCACASLLMTSLTPS